MKWWQEQWIMNHGKLMMCFFGAEFIEKIYLYHVTERKRVAHLVSTGGLRNLNGLWSETNYATLMRAGSGGRKTKKTSGDLPESGRFARCYMII